jgi:hypothetical protein
MIAPFIFVFLSLLHEDVILLPFKIPDEDLFLKKQRIINIDYIDLNNLTKRTNRIILTIRITLPALAPDLEAVAMLVPEPKAAFNPPPVTHSISKSNDKVEIISNQKKNEPY